MERELENRDELLIDLGEVSVETKGQGGLQVPDGDLIGFYYPAGLIED